MSTKSHDFLSVCLIGHLVLKHEGASSTLRPDGNGRHILRRRGHISGHRGVQRSTLRDECQQVSVVGGMWLYFR